MTKEGRNPNIEKRGAWAKCRHMRATLRFRILVIRASFVIRHSDFCFPRLLLTTVNKGAHADGVFAVLGSEKHFHRDLLHDVLVGILVPGIVAQGPAELALAFGNFSALERLVPVRGD